MELKIENMRKKQFNNRITGTILGVIAPILGLFIVLEIFVLTQGFSFSAMWNEFMSTPNQQSRFLSLSVLINLGVFYLFLRVDWNRAAMGMVLGTMVYIPIIIYLKFFA